MLDVTMLGPSGTGHGPIQILDMVAWVSPSTGGKLLTAWQGFPSSFSQGELWVDVKTHDGTSLINVNLISSVDTTVEQEVILGGLVLPATAGVTIREVTARLGGFVRVELQNNAVPSRAVISAWLVPKMS